MKLYVGNLPFSATRDGLLKMFESFGEIEEALVVENKFSGRSKGFGFVTFKEEASGKKAIEELNGKEFEGRTLTVSEAKPFDPDAKPKRNFQQRRSFGNRDGAPRRRF